MPKYKIKYNWIQSDHVFASPTFHHEEIVEAESEEKLKNYIESQSDGWGNKYKLNKDFGTNKLTRSLNYISNQGSVEVSKYNPKIKNI